MRNFAIWSPSENEKENILSQHKELYNGYQTLNPAAMEKVQPLYTQDFANDKDGITVNNKGEVKKYTNMGINESINEADSMCEQCGGDMKENVCEQCGSVNEGMYGQDLDTVEDIDPKAHVDYIEEDDMEEGEYTFYPNKGESDEQYDAVEAAYQFKSHGPEDVYGTLHDYDESHPHHDYDSMEDVEKYDPSSDLSHMFDVNDGYAYRDEDSDTFQHDAGDINRMGDEGLGQDTENDMDLGKSKPAYNFYSGGSGQGDEFFEEMEEMTESEVERKRIVEMIDRMKNFM
jgi:hypothetical protein